VLTACDLGGVASAGVACCLVPSGGGSQADAEELTQDDGGQLGGEVHERRGPAGPGGDAEPGEADLETRGADGLAGPAAWEQSGVVVCVTDGGVPAAAADESAYSRGERFGDLDGRGIRAPLAGLRAGGGAAAIFAFPLQIGAIRAGVLGLYRERPGPLTAFQLGDALIFADTATLLLLDAQDQAGGDLAALAGPGGQPDLALRRAEIDQATGMLTEQLGAGIGDAFVRLRAYAYARDLRLTDVARDIVARRLRLHPDPSRDGEA
jgi:hypothetical protein